MDDGPMADVCELRERGDDGLVRRGDYRPPVRRVRRSIWRHDARWGAETRSELEDGSHNGRARLAPDPVVQLDRGAVHAGGDAVPDVPRGVPSDRRILRRDGDHGRIHLRGRWAAPAA